MLRRRQGVIGSCGSTATNSTRTHRPRMADQKTTGPTMAGRAAPHPEAPPQTGAESFAAPADAGVNPAEELAQLRMRLADLQRERDHLIAVVDILQEISASLHFVDILQTIARKLGNAFGLDRCAIFLNGAADEVGLVESLQDPSLRYLGV